MLPHHSPGVRSWNYYSYFQSPYHIWFQELGYPELDIIDWPDGEWAIIEYQNSPVVPCTTKWKVILAGLRNVEISWGFIKRYIDQCNPMSTFFWDRLEQREKEQDAEWETNERNAEDRAQRAAQLVIRNPELMERIARRGIREMDLVKIRKNIPDYKFR